MNHKAVCPFTENPSTNPYGCYLDNQTDYGVSPNCWVVHGGKCPSYVEDELVSALLLLADIARGDKIPRELELRRACALVYADHLRLENHLYYEEEIKQGKAKKTGRGHRAKGEAPLSL